MLSLLNSPKRIATILLFAISFNSNIVLATSHANKLLAVSDTKRQETSAEQTWNDNEDDDWADDWSDEEVSSPWQLTGFVEAAYGQFLQDNIVENSAALNELRARFNIGYSHQLFELNGKVDTYYDAVLEIGRASCRERV